MKILIILAVLTSILTGQEKATNKSLKLLLDDFNRFAKTLRENGKLTEIEMKEFESVYSRSSKRPLVEYEEQILLCKKMDLEPLMILCSAISYSPHLDSIYLKFSKSEDEKIALIAVSAFLEREGLDKSPKLPDAIAKASKLARSADTVVSSVATLMWSSGLRISGQPLNPAVESAQKILKSLSAKKVKTQSDTELIALMKRVSKFPTDVDGENKE